MSRIKINFITIEKDEFRLKDGTEIKMIKISTNLYSCDLLFYEKIDKLRKSKNKALLKCRSSCVLIKVKSDKIEIEIRKGENSTILKTKITKEKFSILNFLDKL